MWGGGLASDVCLAVGAYSFMIFERLRVSVHGSNIQIMTSRCGFMRPLPPSQQSMVKGRKVLSTSCAKIEVEGTTFNFFLKKLTLSLLST